MDHSSYTLQLYNRTTQASSAFLKHLFLSHYSWSWWLSYSVDHLPFVFICPFGIFWGSANSGSGSEPASIGELTMAAIVYNRFRHAVPPHQSAYLVAARLTRSSGGSDGAINYLVLGVPLEYLFPRLSVGKIHVYRGMRRQSFLPTAQSHLSMSILHSFCRLPDHASVSEASSSKCFSFFANTKMHCLLIRQACQFLLIAAFLWEPDFKCIESVCVPQKLAFSPFQYESLPPWPPPHS